MCALWFEQQQGARFWFQLAAQILDFLLCICAACYCYACLYLYVKQIEYQASDLLLAKRLGLCVSCGSSLWVKQAHSAVSWPVQCHQSGMGLRDCILMHASYNAEQLYHYAAFGEGLLVLSTGHAIISAWR